MKKTFIGQSIGLEIETENIHAGQLPELGNFSTHRDASIETDFYVGNNKGFMVESSDIKLDNRNVTAGIEIISGILDTETPNYFKDIKRLCSILQNLGESEESFRAGIHVHVSCSYNLEILKAIMILGSYYEPLFFQVGGMGYKFRGELNDSIYMRPITKTGPVVIQIPNNKYAQVFNLKDLLESKNSTEFIHRYGNIDLMTGNRWFPARYHWLNLAPLITQGSLEFRVFNKSLNPLYIYSIIDFSKKFVQQCLRLSTEKEIKYKPVNSIFEVNDRDYIFRLLEEFNDYINLDTNAYTGLVKIIERTPTVNLKPGYVFCHLRDQRTHWAKSSYEPPILNPEKDNILRPSFEDIHTLRDRRNREQQNLISEQSVRRLRIPTENSSTTPFFSASVTSRPERSSENVIAERQIILERTIMEIEMVANIYIAEEFARRG